MTKRPKHVSERLWNCRHTPATPEEEDWGRRTLIRQRYGGDLDRALLDAPSRAEAVREFHRWVDFYAGCGCSGGGRIGGKAAHEQVFYSDGIDCWYGDVAHRWRWMGGFFSYADLHGERVNIRVPSLFYILEDVPDENIRYCRISAGDYVDHVRVGRFQPSLLEVLEAV